MNNAINVLCCLLTGANAGNKCTGPLQVLCHVSRIEHQRGVEKAEENNHGAENYDVQRLARPNQQRQVFQPSVPSDWPNHWPREAGNKKNTAGQKNRGNHTGQ